MGEALDSSAGVLANIGVEQKQVIAGLATLQNVGQKGSMAGRGLKAMGVQIAKIGEDLRKFGVDTSDLFDDRGEIKGIKNVLDAFSGMIDPAFRAEIREYIKSQREMGVAQDAIEKGVRDQFSRAPGIGAINNMLDTFASTSLSLLLANEESFNDMVGKLEGAGGTIQTGVRRVMAGVSGDFGRFKNDMEQLAISIAQSGVIQAASSLFKKLGFLGDKFEELDPKSKKFLVTFTMIAAVAAPLLAVLGGIAATLGGPFLIAAGLATAGIAALVTWWDELLRGTLLQLELMLQVAEMGRKLPGFSGTVVGAALDVLPIDLDDIRRERNRLELFQNRMSAPERIEAVRAARAADEADIQAANDNGQHEKKLKVLLEGIGLPPMQATVEGADSVTATGSIHD